MSGRSTRGLPAWAPAAAAWAPAAAAWAAVAALVATSFAERWAALGSSPFPIGIDGYYYPIQLRALLETGGLAYPAAPLGFWLMAPLAALTDPITGAKLGAALYGALIAVPAYGVGARLGRGRGAGLVAAALASRAAGSAYLTIEFVKNGIGLTVGLAALWLILRALEAPSRGRVAAAALGFAAAALTHKMAAGLVGVIAAPAVLAAAAARGGLRGRGVRHAITGLGAAAGAALALGLLFPERLLSPADAALARGLFTADARWDAPAFAGARVELALGHEALAAACVAIAAALAGTRRGGRAIGAATRLAIPRELVVEPAPGDARPAAAPGDAAATLALAALALAIALPWLDVSDAQGLAFRLRIAAFVPLALLAAALAGRLVARVHRRDLALAALAVVLALHRPGDRDEGRIATHPALVTSALALTGRIPPGDTVIVPERHVAFLIAWYTRARVSLRPERVPPERRWRVVLLNWIRDGGPELDRALLAAREGPPAPAPGAAAPAFAPPIGLHPSHPDGMVLLTESTWQAIAASLPPGSPWPSWPTR